MPTTNIRSIGSGGGRDFATLSAWEAATDVDLVATDVVEIGEMYNDSVFGAGATLSGAITDATRYRWLRAAAGNRYRIETDTGVRIQSGSQSITTGMIRMVEDFLRFGGGVRCTCTDTTNAVSCVNLELERDMVAYDIHCTWSGNNTNANSAGINCRSGANLPLDPQILNVGAQGSFGATGGMAFGIITRGAIAINGGFLVGATVDGVNQNGVRGNAFSGSNDGNIAWSNAIGFGSFGSDYVNFAGVSIDFCSSGDASVPVDSSNIPNIVDTIEFVAPNATPPNYHLRTSGTSWRSGLLIDHTLRTINEDFDGVPHGTAAPGFSNRGIYDGPSTGGLPIIFHAILRSGKRRMNRLTKL